MTSTGVGVTTTKSDLIQYTFVSGLKKQRIKRFSTKSKNGCETCKRRRIKCDQGRPTCVNCNRSNRTCEGYQTLYVDFGKQNGINNLPRLSSISSLLPNYGYGDEKRWLGIFREKTAILISKFSTPYFWITLVPQASCSHEGIKHAMIAVAMACEEHDNMHLYPTSRGLERVKSLHHYNEAIRVITMNKQPKDIVLLMSVLFWTYENLKNRPIIAITHLKAAIDMLNEGRQMITHREDIISRYIEPCLQECMIFASTVLPTGGQEKRIAPSMGEFRKALIDLVPQEFPRDIHASRSDLEKCQRLVLMCKHMAMARDNPQPTYESVREVFWKWKSITDKHCSSWPQDDVRMLLTHYEVTYISIDIIEAHFTGTKLDYEALRPRFEHVLSEMQYLTSTDLRRHKTIDMSMIMVLSFIGRQHPDDDIGLAAIAILEEYEFFEGLWNSRVAAELIRMMRTLDAECASCKYGDLAMVFNKSSEMMRAGQIYFPKQQVCEHTAYNLTRATPTVAVGA